MIRTYVFAIFLSLFMLQDVIAQPDSLGNTLTLPKATLKINPTCLLNPWRSSLFISSDIRLHKNVSIEPGVGWFFGRWQKMNDYGMNGARVRLGLKYHWIVDHETFPYLGIEAKYNYIAERINENVCRYGCQYSEIFNVKKHTQTGGVALKAGSLFFLGPKKRFVFDLYGGIGYKYTTRTTPKLPEDAELIPVINRSIMTIDLSPGRYHLVDFLMGFSLGYSFW